MDELQTILAEHQTKKNNGIETNHHKNRPIASSSEIPDLFFDDVLVKFKLNRIEILVIMYLYRCVWCRPNLYKVHGISQILSHTEMANKLGLSIDEIYQALKKLEDLGFISTIRSGQYFVRKYFTKQNDEFFAHTYNEFEI
ncbi:MAG: hypothetical protein H6622_15425 [Halobacteriovoraceae bacterium]|nr:hypothetical protein [Halobacteriovoraceae bacterium]